MDDILNILMPISFKSSLGTPVFFTLPQSVGILIASYCLNFHSEFFIYSDLLLSKAFKIEIKNSQNYLVIIQKE